MREVDSLRFRTRLNRHRANVFHAARIGSYALGSTIMAAGVSDVAVTEVTRQDSTASGLALVVWGAGNVVMGWGFQKREQHIQQQTVELQQQIDQLTHL